MSGENKKTKIIQSAQALITQKGMKNCTISEIAQDAGVTDSILYHYFKDKEDLLFVSLEALLLRFEEGLNFQLSGVVDPLSKLGKIIWFHLYMYDNASEDASILKSLLLECRSRTHFYEHNTFRIMLASTATLRNVIKEGKKKGIFGEFIDVSLVTEMIFGLLDEESLSRFTSCEVKKTTPDFDSIMLLVLAMLGVKDRYDSTLKKDKKRIILKSAKALFAEKGFDGATMAEISKCAKVAEGTIYGYFKNKQDLFYTISNIQIDRNKKSKNNFIAPENALLKLHRLIYLQFLHMSSDQDFLMIFLHRLKYTKQFYETDTYQKYMKYYDDLFDVLDEGKEQGIFHPDIDNRIYKNLFLGGFSHLAIRWFVLDLRTPGEMMNEFNTLTYLLCRGIVTNNNLDKLQDLELI